MNHILRAIVGTSLVLSLVSCSEKDSATDRPDTTTGATTHVDEEPDTTTGATQPSEGSIVKGRIGTGTIIVDGMTYNDAYGIDFNKDGYLEFRIVNNGTTLRWEPADADGNLPRGPAMSGGQIAVLQKHTTISPTLDYSTSSFANLPETSALPEKFYVAFRLAFDSVHYGWAKVKYKDGELEWDKCAYCTTPGTTLTAGDD